MRTNPWKNSATLNPNQPGWDQSTLIAGYEIDTASTDSNRAVFEVIYHVIARRRQNIHGPYLVFEPEKKTVHFELEKTT